MLAVWLWSIIPLAGGTDADQAFISEKVQVWSRSGEGADVAARFRPQGDLLTATLFLLGSLAAVFVARNDFRADKPARTLMFLGVALLAAAGAGWFIAKPWTGALMFPAGSVNTAWLYMATRAFLIQMFFGFFFLLVYGALVIGDMIAADRPRGFHLVVLNWLIVVATWVVAYLGLYLAPGLIRAG